MAGDIRYKMTKFLPLNECVPIYLIKKLTFMNRINWFRDEWDHWLVDDWNHWFHSDWDDRFHWQVLNFGHRNYRNNFLGHRYVFLWSVSILARIAVGDSQATHH